MTDDNSPEGRAGRFFGFATSPLFAIILLVSVQWAQGQCETRYRTARALLLSSGDEFDGHPLCAVLVNASSGAVSIAPWIIAVVGGLIVLGIAYAVDRSRSNRQS